MLRVVVRLSESGCLASFHASGHAGGGKGGNIACAAATGLLRTAARMLSTTEDLVEGGTADAPGEMSLTLRGQWQKRPEWLMGVTDFLIVGLRDLQEEFPREISVRIM